MLILLIHGRGFTQEKDVGSWHTISAQLNSKSKWLGFAEIQTRSRKLTDQFFYYELKGGIGYNVLPNFSALLAVGRYATYSGDGNYEKPLNKEEFRIWQQLTFSDRLGRLMSDHRFRAEQRFIHDDKYRNRFRYRLNLVLPLSHKELIPNTFYLTTFNEIFLSNRAPHFERNRIFGGGGYVFSKMLTTQAGYLYQYDYSPPSTIGKQFINLSLVLKLTR
ncbi:MAG: DUF2490 domain-containing protein [Bacteroidetes bacterium]|nr:DUF2490 domain-containing protein [Bacteroidota bacterium]